jgi:hypothetical protein
VNASLDFEMDFNMYSSPDWLKDKGSGVVNITDFNLTMRISPFTHKGRMQFEVSELYVNVDGCKLHFDGYTDFAKSLNSR